MVVFLILFGIFLGEILENIVFDMLMLIYREYGLSGMFVDCIRKEILI